MIEAAEITRAQIRRMWLVTSSGSTEKKGHLGELKGSRMKGEKSKPFRNTIHSAPVELCYSSQCKAKDLGGS